MRSMMVAWLTYQSAHCQRDGIGNSSAFLGGSETPSMYVFSVATSAEFVYVWERGKSSSRGSWLVDGGSGPNCARCIARLALFQGGPTFALPRPRFMSKARSRICPTDCAWGRQAPMAKFGRAGASGTGRGQQFRFRGPMLRCISMTRAWHGAARVPRVLDHTR